MPQLAETDLIRLQALYDELLDLPALKRDYERDRSALDRDAERVVPFPEYVEHRLWARFKPVLAKAKLAGRGRVLGTTGEEATRHRSNLLDAIWELTIEYAFEPKIDEHVLERYVVARLAAKLDEIDKHGSGRYDRHGKLIRETTLDRAPSGDEEDEPLVALLVDDAAGLRAGEAADAAPPTCESIASAMSRIAAASQTGVHVLVDTAKAGELRAGDYRDAYRAEKALGGTRDDARRNQARGRDAADAANEVARAMDPPPSAAPSPSRNKLPPEQLRPFLRESLVAGTGSVVSASQLDRTTFILHAVAYRDFSPEWRKASEARAAQPIPSGLGTLEQLMRQRD